MAWRFSSSFTHFQVDCRYLISIFLGHATAADIDTAFKNGLKALDIDRLVQIGMDGPNTNLKFLREFRKEKEVNIIYNLHMFWFIKL